MIPHLSIYIGISVNPLVALLFVRPEKFQFMEKWKNRNFGYKIVISVKNLKFILWISDDETDFTVGIVSRNLASTSNFVEFRRIPRQSELAHFSRHRISGTVKRFSMRRKSHITHTHVP